MRIRYLAIEVSNFGATLSSSSVKRTADSSVVDLVVITDTANLQHFIITMGTNNGRIL